MPIPRAYRKRNAPWNERPAPECPCCRGTIVEFADHEEWCEDKLTREEIHEYYAEEPATFEDY